MDLVPVKFFLTGDTEATGMEEWFWDGQPVPQGGLFPAPRARVTIDGANHRLVVKYDQSKFTNVDLGPEVHRVTFKGTDVFGTELTAERVVALPASGSRFVGGPVLIDDDIFTNPLGPDNPLFQGFATDVAESLGSLGTTGTGRRLAETLAVAIGKGTAELDQTGALLLVEALKR